MDVHRGAHRTVTSAPPALELRGIVKHFGGVTALDTADCTVRRGSVHAVLGENGAGKTTLMRIAYGLIRPERGAIERNGERVQFPTPSAAIAAGIAMVQQHFSLVPELTVAENVALGGRGRFDAVEAAKRVSAIGDATGLTLDARARVADLPVGAQQRVEIIKALARSATLLILDEPTAVLTPNESRELSAQLRAFAAAGNAVVFVTHKLRDALDVADDITVLRGGRTAHTTSASDASESSLIEAMLGERIPVPPITLATTPGRTMLRAHNATVTDDRGTAVLRNASVTVCAGEILGVAGVEGNGQRELLRVLAGRTAPSAGSVDRPITVGFVPEDRQRDALALELTLTENVALAGAARRRGLIHWGEMEEETRSLLTDFEVMSEGPSARAISLSGGNQQRFVLGRELRMNPQALICENPTRGLDVRAAALVYAKLRQARAAGAAIVLYSADLDELLLIADRVVVCFRGEVRNVARTATAITRALVGGGE
jgi:simple sugar transport system ATP-binding protein